MDSQLIIQMKQYRLIFSTIILGLILSFLACESDTKKPSPSSQPKTVKIPAFAADSAYAFIEKQLAFGPRVPGTEEHKACKDWLVSTLSGYGADVIEQEFIANIYTGDRWQSYNIIGQINPKVQKRIILAAHWDTRMIAEEDKDAKRKDEPILGADDGGSGVGVLLEIARLLHENPINDLGVDIILFDAEDQGKRGPEEPSTNWCLGSQHWSKNKHKNGYRAQYGILLDMVGGKNPKFGKEQFSKAYAGVLQEKIWTMAAAMGYSNMFSNENSGAITDDHYFVNTIAGIPMIDIINHDVNGTGFASHWHTHGDDMSAIDKRTLKSVGQVVTAAIYKESINKF